MSIEEENRIKELERQEVKVFFGNQGQSKMYLGKYLDKRFLLRIYTHEIRASIVKMQENEHRPITVKNQEYQCALRPILMGYILIKKFHVPFNKEYACYRLSLKSWPTRHVNGNVNKSFRHIRPICFILYGAFYFANTKGQGSGVCFLDRITK